MVSTLAGMLATTLSSSMEQPANVSAGMVLSMSLFFGHSTVCSFLQSWNTPSPSVSRLLGSAMDCSGEPENAPQLRRVTRESAGNVTEVRLDDPQPPTVVMGRPSTVAGTSNATAPLSTWCTVSSFVSSSSVSQTCAGVALPAT